MYMRVMYRDMTLNPMPSRWQSLRETDGKNPSPMWPTLAVGVAAAALTTRPTSLDRHAVLRQPRQQLLDARPP